MHAQIKIWITKKREVASKINNNRSEDAAIIDTCSKYKTYAMLCVVAARPHRVFISLAHIVTQICLFKRKI